MQDCEPHLDKCLTDRFLTPFVRTAWSHSLFAAKSVQSKWRTPISCSLLLYIISSLLLKRNYWIRDYWNKNTWYSFCILQLFVGVHVGERTKGFIPTWKLTPYHELKTSELFHSSHATTTPTTPPTTKEEFNCDLGECDGCLLACWMCYSHVPCLWAHFEYGWGG